MTRRDSVGSWVKIIGIIVWICGGIVGFIGLVGTGGQQLQHGTRAIALLLFMVPGATLFRIGRWLEKRYF